MKASQPTPDPTLVAQQQSALAQNVRSIQSQSGMDQLSMFRMFGGVSGGMSNGPAAGGSMVGMPSLAGSQK
jgi:hypothetical protein